MIEEIDISVLFEKTDLSKSAILWIEPLAPLSMIASIPGSYYRTQDEPSIHMIYGMLENLLGWHFDDTMRKDILKKMKSEFEKIYKFEEFSSESSSVNYTPILQNHIKIETPALFQPQKMYYEDYWTQHLKDSDKRHLNGSRNYDVSVEQWVKRIKELEKQAKNPKNKGEKKVIEDKIKEIESEIMGRMKDRLPNYYSSPKKREFIAAFGKYGYKIHSSENMINKLSNAIAVLNNPIYLGTNEGWIDIKVQKL